MFNGIGGPLVEVRINGRTEALAGEVTILEFLQKKGLNLEAVVVEHNLVIVARQEWGNMHLQEGDSLEILHFVGGG